MMMKKFGKVAATTLLGATLVGAGTFALFTSQKVNNDNTFTAGNVSISMDETEGKVAEGMLHFENLAPGDEGTGENTLTITNDGSLAEWVGLKTALKGDLFKGVTPLKLSYTVKVMDNDESEVHEITSEDAGSNQTPFKLEPGEHAVIEYNYEFPSGAGNTYFDASGTADITVNAVQARNNTKTDNSGPTSW